jgi:hypothetical protein
VELTEAIAVLAAFDRHRVEYVLVGSMAMAAQGLIRATRDIDLFVAPHEQNVARLRAALREVFDDPGVEEISAEDLNGEYPVIQYAPPGRQYWIDLLARLGDELRFEDVESERLVVQGVAIRVATPRMLYRMKRDTVRPQDLMDAAALKARFDLEDD